MLDRRCSFVCALAFVSAALPAVAQKIYSKQDYTQAERWMSYNVSGLVQHTVHGVTYLSDGRVFYSDPGAGGTAYLITGKAPGAATWTVAPAFDNAKLAAALNVAMSAHAPIAEKKTTVEAGKLGVTAYKAEANGGFAVTTREGVFHCDAAVTMCTAEPKPPTEETTAEKADTTGNAKAAKKPSIVRRHAGTENVSPDKSMEAFIHENNLWVRMVATGEEHS